MDQLEGVDEKVEEKVVKEKAGGVVEEEKEGDRRGGDAEVKEGR